MSHVVEASLIKLSVHRYYLKESKQIDHELFEGELTLPQPQQDAYKQMIGDGLASVTASRELSETSYGRGGKLFLSVSLACDQSEAGIASGIAWAKALVEQKVWEHHAEFKTQLVQRGLIDP
jgi:hypothetical protein